MTRSVGWRSIFVACFASLVTPPAFTQSVTVSPTSVSFGNKAEGTSEFCSQRDAEERAEDSDYDHQHQHEPLGLQRNQQLSGQPVDTGGRCELHDLCYFQAHGSGGAKRHLNRD
jgi:hypothetical protein